MQNNIIENIYYKETGKYGQSIFAAKSFEKDEIVFTVCGPISKIPSAYTVPIDFDLFIDPIGPGRLLNHSCDPSCGIKNRTQIVAIRDLEKDEEITIDYAMLVPLRRDYPRVNIDVPACKCGSKNCRGEFGSYETLPRELKEKYKGYISDYLM